MRCAEVRPLVEAFVDGSLDEKTTARIAAHASSCERCALQISLARRVSAALSAPVTARAPKGFAERVMTDVYRQALAGERLPASGREATRGSRRAPSLMYRRMGLSFVVTAAVLAASLLVPRVAYPTLFASRMGGTTIVQEAMHGADGVVQELLMEQRNGGSAQ